MWIRYRGVAFPAAVLASTLGVIAQTPQQAGPPAPLFKSNLVVVHIDVTAVDKDNKPVLGLKASDFTVYDRKKPQPIVAFDEISHAGTKDASPLAALPPTVKHDVSDNQASRDDRLVIIVLDDLHIFKGRTDRTKEIAKKVLTDLGAQATVGVLFTSGEHNIEMTDDRDEAVAAIDTFKSRKLVPRPTISPEDGGGQTMMQNIQTQQTLEYAARLLETGASQRKAFVYLTEGTNKELQGMYTSEVTPCEAKNPRSPCFHSVSLIKMMDAMQRSNVVTYIIDPRGEVTLDNITAECRPGGGVKCDPCLGDCPGQIPAHDAWPRLAQRGLQITAAASGGFAVTNTNDFTSGISRIVQDLDHYYLLGFSPNDPEKSGLKALDITCDRPGVTLHFRTSYSTAVPAPPKNSDPLTLLSSGVMPRTDLSLRLAATSLLTHTVILLEVAEPRSALTRGDGSVSDALHYAVLAVDLKSDKLVREFKNTADLSARQGTALGDNIVFQVPVDLTLPPGRYQLRASATSTSLAKGGSVYLAVDVPNYRLQGVALSGLLLGYAGGPRVAMGKTAEGRASTAATMAVGVKDFTPTLDRVFTTTDTLRVYGELGIATGSTLRRIAVEVVDSKGRSVKSFSPIVTPTIDHIDQAIPLTGLAPGAYILRVTASSSFGAPSPREIGFAIK